MSDPFLSGWIVIKDVQCEQCEQQGLTSSVKERLQETLYTRLTIASVLDVIPMYRPIVSALARFGGEIISAKGTIGTCIYHTIWVQCSPCGCAR